MSIVRLIEVSGISWTVIVEEVFQIADNPIERQEDKSHQRRS